jgi:DNA repair ATPase RecN
MTNPIQPPSRRETVNQATSVALMVLDDIQGNVTTLASTVTGIPSPEDYKVAETQLENCRRALAKVTRSDKTVIERKETITRNLNNIAGRLSELSHLISQDQTPIPYYTGKLFCFLIYNELH